jgi:multidrug efflux pump
MSSPPGDWDDFFASSNYYSGPPLTDAMVAAAEAALGYKLPSSLPFAIILIVPMCLLAGIAGVWLVGLDNNIFTQIGLVVLVGLAAKNAILIVEFAKEREAEGMTRIDATVDACKTRLRPILMTSFAFILGVAPLIFAKGAGFEMRVALGVAVFSGMIGVTLFGLVFTPVFFVFIRRLSGPERPAAQATAPVDGAALSKGAATVPVKAPDHSIKL